MSLSLSGSGEISGFDAGLSGFGGLVVVKSALFTGTQTNSTAAGANFAVTDLSITHEVADASNKLIISAFLGVAANSSGRANVGLAIYDGTSLIGVGDAASNRSQVGAGGQATVNTANYVSSNPSVTFVHTPSTGSKTYTVRAVNVEPTTQTIYINRSEQDTDIAGRSRGASALVVMEVSV